MRTCVWSRCRGLTVFEVQERWVDVEGDESQAMGEDFVSNDGGVAPYIRAFYACCGYLHRSGRVSGKHGRIYLGYEDTSEGIGNGGIDADEVELDGAIRETLDSDGESLAQERVSSYMYERGRNRPV